MSVYDPDLLSPDPEVRKIDSAMRRVGDELLRAQERFPAFASAHEGLAVIREEYLELERAIFHGDGDEAYTEAVQLAAMASRYLTDIGRRGRNSERAESLGGKP